MLPYWLLGIKRPPKSLPTIIGVGQRLKFQDTTLVVDMIEWNVGGGVEVRLREEKRYRNET